CNLNAHGRKNVGKPYEGKPHVRFDEEGLVGSSPSLYLAALPRLFVLLDDECLRVLLLGRTLVNKRQ
ncbi:MAG: hypothetical protein ACYC56_11895, partial [Candidatus Aquicultor sp.]